MICPIYRAVVCMRRRVDELDEVNVYSPREDTQKNVFFSGQTTKSTGDVGGG